MTNEMKTMGLKFHRYWRRNKIPVTCLLELTPRCTLDCKMCYVHLTPEQMGDRRELTAEQWIRIIDEALDAGMFTAALTGGECMLHPGFWEILGHLRERGVNTSVNTNAYVLTDAQIERLSQSGVGMVRVTIYGSSPEEYERLTGRADAYERVVENIKKMKAAGLPVSAAATLTKYNYDGFWDVLKLRRELGVPLNMTADLFTPYEETGRNVEDCALSKDEILAFYQKYRRLVRKEPFPNEPITEEPAWLEDAPPVKGMCCGSGQNSFFVHWDGTIAPCVNFRGNLRVQDVGFAAAWEEVKREAAEYPQPVECSHCKLLKVCNPCVFVRHDPKNIHHANLEHCKMMYARYNQGLISLEKQPQTIGGEEISVDSAPDDC